MADPASCDQTAGELARCQQVGGSSAPAVPTGASFGGPSALGRRSIGPGEDLDSSRREARNVASRCSSRTVAQVGHERRLLYARHSTAVDPKSIECIVAAMERQRPYRGIAPSQTLVILGDRIHSRELPSRYARRVRVWPWGIGVGTWWGFGVGLGRRRATPFVEERSWAGCRACSRRRSPSMVSGVGYSVVGVTSRVMQWGLRNRPPAMACASHTVPESLERKTLASRRLSGFRPSRSQGGSVRRDSGVLSRSLCPSMLYASAAAGPPGNSTRRHFREGSGARDGGPQDHETRRARLRHRNRPRGALTPVRADVGRRRQAGLGVGGNRRRQDHASCGGSSATRFEWASSTRPAARKPGCRQAAPARPIRLDQRGTGAGLRISSRGTALQADVTHSATAVAVNVASTGHGMAISAYRIRPRRAGRWRRRQFRPPRRAPPPYSAFRAMPLGSPVIPMTAPAFAARWNEDSGLWGSRTGHDSIGVAGIAHGDASSAGVVRRHGANQTSVIEVTEPSGGPLPCTTRRSVREENAAMGRCSSAREWGGDDTCQGHRHPAVAARRAAVALGGAMTSRNSPRALESLEKRGRCRLGDEEQARALLSR